MGTHRWPEMYRSCPMSTRYRRTRVLLPSRLGCRTPQLRSRYLPSSGSRILPKSGSSSQPPPPTLRPRYLLPSRSSPRLPPRSPRSRYLLVPRIRLLLIQRSYRSCGHQGQGPAAAVKVKVSLLPPPMKSRLLMLPRPRSCHLQRSRHLKRSRVRLPPTTSRSCCRQGQVQAATVKVRVNNEVEVPACAKGPATSYPTEVEVLLLTRSSSGGYHQGTCWCQGSGYFLPHGARGPVVTKIKARLLPSRSRYPCCLHQQSQGSQRHRGHGPATYRGRGT